MSVLIVGAGPVGLSMAIELQRRGLPYRIVERDEAPHSESRATDIQARTLDVFEDMGLLDAILSVGRKRPRISMFMGGEEVAQIAIETTRTKHNYTVGLSQHRTQEVLEAHLETLGGRVERSVRFSSLCQDEEGVDVVLLHPDHTWEESRFEWLVGCDGGRSMVRKALGIGFEGDTLPDAFFLADLDLECDFLDDDDTAIFMNSAGSLILLPIEGGPKRVRIFGELGQGDDPDLNEENFRRLVEARIERPVEISRLGWSTVFKVHTRQASDYRKGRAFLCGDAAHCHSPAGGHGMNFGIQDAYNLAWKLALVQEGRAKPSLLETYYAERHPVVTALLTMTAFGTRLAISRNRLAFGAIASVAKVLTKLSPIRKRMILNLLELDVNYRESPICWERHSSILEAHLLHSDKLEEPSLRDHRDFELAPHAGDLALDGALLNGRSVFDVLRGPHHTLLLFDGRSPTDAGYRNLCNIAASVTGRYLELVSSHIIVPRSSCPASLGYRGSILYDGDGSIHELYGANSECLYLIRPDGYIGFRCQPADGDSLIEYLDSYLCPLSEDE